MNMYDFIQGCWFCHTTQIGFCITGHFLTDPVTDPLSIENKTNLRWDDKNKRWLGNINIPELGEVVMLPKENMTMDVIRISDSKAFQFEKHGYNKE